MIIYHCPKCEYDLRQQCGSHGATCPECGEHWTDEQLQQFDLQAENRRAAWFLGLLVASPLYLLLINMLAVYLVHPFILAFGLALPAPWAVLGGQQPGSTFERLMWGLAYAVGGPGLATAILFLLLALLQSTGLDVSPF